jgi:HK97 family phage portal protein
LTVISRIKSLFGFGAEGSYRAAGAFSDLGNWFPLDPLDGTGFHRDLSHGRRLGIAAVQAAIGKYSDACTAMPIEHYRDQNGFEIVATSAFTRFVRRPTRWQTFAEWMSEGVRVLLETGNAVGLITRNGRAEIETITWATAWALHVDHKTGAEFYSLSMPSLHGEWVDAVLVPARDVFHIRINVDTRRNSLRGRSPLEWCAAAMATNAQLSAFLNWWLNNRASPSFVLTTDAPLTKDQIASLRAAWENQSAGMNSGKTPVLAGGLKPVAMGVSPGDDLLISTFNLSVTDIARAFGIPKSLLGIDETASNTNNLIREWVALGLGSFIETWEQAFEKAFEMPSNEHVEFNADAILRLDPQAEAARLKELVVGGILSIDEARHRLRIKPVINGYGSVPTQQQQQVPLDLLHEIHAGQIAAKLSAASIQPPEPAEDPEKAISFDGEISRALVVELFKRKAAR